MISGIGILAKVLADQMSAGFMEGADAMMGGFNHSDMFEPMLSNNPVSAIGIVSAVVGGIMALRGTFLAIYLRKKFRDE